ncbi:hypothetical protein KCP69_23645 [Salmonella enterica subsp. enterica]|nr:hypothetical protein KCP69_23645 [Salmonella enterica subsp. enterica]
MAQATDAVAQDTVSASGEFDALKSGLPTQDHLCGKAVEGGADAGATGAGKHDHRQR